MFWKDELACEILSVKPEQLTKAWFESRRDKYPSLRVRTTDVKGLNVVINFDSKGVWSKPIEWAKNHRQSVFEQYSVCKDRMSCLFGNNEATLKRFAPELAIFKSVGNDLTKAQELVNKLAEAEKVEAESKAAVTEANRWKLQYRNLARLSLYLARYLMSQRATESEVQMFWNLTNTEDVREFLERDGKYKTSFYTDLKDLFKHVANMIGL